MTLSAVRDGWDRRADILDLSEAAEDGAAAEMAGGARAALSVSWAMYAFNAMYSDQGPRMAGPMAALELSAAAALWLLLEVASRGSGPRWSR